MWEHRKTDNVHILDINVVINWQLSKQGIHWPVSLDGIAGSDVDLLRSSIFLKSSADKLLVFKWSQAQVQFFLIHMKYVFMCCTINILISYWPWTRKFSQLLQAGKTVAFDFVCHGHALVMLYVQFYAPIGQNLTGAEFMQKIYAASWILFTFTSAADGVLCQLLMFLTVFFHWMYKMKFSCYQESSVVHG